MNCLAANGQGISAKTTKERSYPKERKIMGHTPQAYIKNQLILDKDKYCLKITRM
ncbi:hypothetical protein GQ568_03300 [Patescibacteria group bacterium]|nr:hypothetical protein [Patescibacteria group bacterium]